MEAEALPDPVAHQEAAIEHRDPSLAPMVKRTVDVDLDVVVAVVMDRGVGASSHRLPP
jgi:hypothetical protein